MSHSTRKDGPGCAQRRRRVHGTPTPNGRRSSFRDWAAEATDHPREVMEAALAGGRVRQALKSGGAKAGSRPVTCHEPAYPLGPRFAGPRQGLGGGCAPFDPPEVRAPAERVLMADRRTVTASAVASRCLSRGICGR